MINVVFDIGALAAPSPGSAYEDLWSYSERLDKWSGYLGNKQFYVCSFDDRTEIESILSESELHVMNNHIRELGRRSPSLVPDICKCFYRLIGRLKSLKAIHGVEAIQWSKANINPTPNRDGVHQVLQRTRERDIIFIGLLCKSNEESASQYIFIVSEECDPVIDVMANNVKLDGKVAHKLPKNIDSLKSKVLVCSEFEGLIEHIKEEEILTHASNDKEVELAIKVALFRYEKANRQSADWNKLAMPFIGNTFRESCQKAIENGFLRPEVIIRSVVDVMNEINPSHTHTWNTGKGKGDQHSQRNYGAWRYEIDMRRGARMQFWKGPNGKIELGSVQDHNSTFFPDLTTKS